MGRHASGENNYRVAKGPFIAVLVVIVLVGCVFAWINLRKSNDTAVDAARAECTKGDLTLIVSADPATTGAVQKLVADYGDSNPVIRDYCVRPQLAVTGSQSVVASLLGAGGTGASTSDAGDAGAGDAGATDTPTNQALSQLIPGVWVPADISFVDQAKAAQDIKVNDPEAWLPTITTGIAVPADRADQLAQSTWEQFAEQRIATPGGDDAAVSSLVDARLGGGADAARGRAELGEVYPSNTLLSMLSQNAAGFDGVAATAPLLDMAGDGLTLISPEGSPELHAPIVTFGSGGAIDENVARAAEDFAKFAAEHGADGQAAATSFTPEVSEIFGVLSPLQTDPFAVPPALQQGDQQADQQLSTAAGSVLLLADTSDGIDVPALSQMLSLAIDVAPSGRYGVWSIAPDVQQLVNLPGNEGDNGAEATKAALGTLPTGGGAQLWPALIDAYRTARDAYTPDIPNRIVIVTSGRDASGSDAANAIQQIRHLIDPLRPVTVSIIVLPDGENNNEQLQQLASLTGGEVRTADDYETSLSLQLADTVGLG